MSPLPQMLTISDLVSILQRSRASIYRDIAAGRFPKPKKFGASSRWQREVIANLLETGLGS